MLMSVLSWVRAEPSVTSPSSPTRSIAASRLSRGAGQHLAYAFRNAGLANGYETAIHAVIRDDNSSAVRSAAEGAEIFRRYDLLGCA